MIRNTHLGGILAGAFDDHAFTLIPAFVTGTAEQASCRFSVAQTEALTTPGNISWQQIEERYSELLRSRPTTQEDEVKRQQQLSTLQRFVAAHRRNLSQCQGVFVNGWQRLPSDQEFLEKAAELRQQLANAEVEAFTHQGHERQKKGDLDGAIQDFSEAIRLKADDVDAITSRGLARRDKGDLDGAIRDYTEVIRLKPDNEMITLRGLARRDKGDLDGAIRDYTEVIRLTPGYFAAFALRGIARRDKEDLDGAIQDYSEAIRLKPNYAFAFAKRADARRAKGDEVGAQQDYAESLRLGRPAP